MVPLARRMPAVSARGAVWALVLGAFLFGATGASVLFVGVWRYEASRAKAADAEVQEATQAVTETSEKLRKAQARLERQLALVSQLRQAAKPLVAEAGALGATSQQLTAESAALGSSAAKLTSAVADLGAYLEGTSLVQLDPAYVDDQLAYLEQQLASIQGRADKLASGSKGIAGSREKIVKRADALAKLAGG
jgi:chromosome segregation ATPase